MNRTISIVLLSLVLHAGTLVVYTLWTDWFAAAKNYSEGYDDGHEQGIEEGWMRGHTAGWQAERAAAMVDSNCYCPECVDHEEHTR